MAKNDPEDLKETFNANAQRTEYEVVFEPENSDELRDNTDPRQEPKTVQNRQRTPSGTRINFRTQKPEKQQAEAPKKEEPSNEEVQYELLNGDYNLEEEKNGFRVRAKVTDYPSKEGLNGGRISRLTLSTGDRGEEAVHARFDQGEWEEEMTTGLERQTAMEVMHEYDSGSLEKKQSEPEVKDQSEDKSKEKGDEKDVDKGNGKGKGHTR
jgi:hypothetical protein